MDHHRSAGSQPCLPEFGVVVLGAGFSRRMGVPKLLLPWRESTVVGHTLNVWMSLQAHQIAVVMRPDDRALVEAINMQSGTSVHAIFNPDAGSGMFSSVQAAARWEGWLRTVTHIVLTLGDQPHVPDRTLRELMEFAADHPKHICQPLFDRGPKHPIVFPRTAFAELQNDPGPTLREFLRQRLPKLTMIEINDASLAEDLDTPEDYARLFAAYGRS